MSDSLQPHGLWPARLLCPWHSLGQNPGVGPSGLRDRTHSTQPPLHWQASSLPLAPPEFQSIAQMHPFLASENPFRLTSEFFLSLFWWSLKNSCFYHTTVCPRTFLNFSCPGLEISYFFKNSGSFYWKIVIGTTVQVLSVDITTKSLFLGFFGGQR